MVTFASGPLPSRFGHAMTSLGTADRCVLMFGGLATQSGSVSDAGGIMVDRVAQTWSALPNAAATAPVGRTGHYQVTYTHSKKKAHNFLFLVNEHADDGLSHAGCHERHRADGRRLPAAGLYLGRVPPGPSLAVCGKATETKKKRKKERKKRKKKKTNGSVL